MMATERILSAFIDESGDFGAYEVHAPHYLVTIVFHDQAVSIQDDFNLLDQQIKNLGYPPHALHAGPLIRRENVYQYESREKRRALFHAMYHFARKINVFYLCASIRKNECADSIAMSAKLSRAIADELWKCKNYIEQFDKIIIYYDNGQIELTKVLTSVFNTMFPNVEFRKVRPVEYKLFQTADLICTMELLSRKAESNTFSRSEIEFFHSVRDFRKNYWKNIVKKQYKNMLK